MSNRTVATGRPAGITIIAILLAIAAIISFLYGLTLLGGSPLAIFGSGVRGVFGTALDGIFTIVMSIVELVLAFGLWGLRPWAFWATVIIEAINVLYWLFGLFGQFKLGLGLGSGLIALIVLIYMFADGSVRRAFRV